MQQTRKRKEAGVGEGPGGRGGRGVGVRLYNFNVAIYGKCDICAGGLVQQAWRGGVGGAERGGRGRLHNFTNCSNETCGGGGNGGMVVVEVVVAVVVVAVVVVAVVVVVVDVVVMVTSTAIYIINTFMVGVVVRGADGVGIGGGRRRL